MSSKNTLKDLKKQYPVLQKTIYLDTAATMQKNEKVIKEVSSFLENNYSNIHRGIYEISEQSTKLYEECRSKVAKLLSCDNREIVFTKSATESINVIAQGIKPIIKEMNKKEIVLTEMEHHANILPWQRLAKEMHMTIKYIPITKDFTLDYTKAEKLINKNTAIISLTHKSNVLGTSNNIEKIYKIAKKHSAIVILDATQSIAHMKVSSSYADFIAFSSHKIGGPSGVGVLFGKINLLNKMEPFIVGGDSILSVTKEEVVFQEPPHKFESGTPNIEGVIGLSKAIDIINDIGYEKIQSHVKELTIYTISKLKEFPTIKIFSKDAGIISFSIKGIHPHDVAQILANNTICIRSGHLCCMPLLEVLQIQSLNRISIWAYTEKKDIDTFIKGIKEVLKVFS